MTAKKKQVRYRAVVRVTFAGGAVVEPGNLVPAGTDVPDWLVDQGLVTKE